MHGLDLFHDYQEDEDTRSSLINNSHVTWLKDLCTKEPWARDVAAQWALENCETSPEWAWLFSNGLGIKPSSEFIYSVLQALDDSSNDLYNGQLMLLKTQAPDLALALMQAKQLYTELYGGAPTQQVDLREYWFTRAHSIKNMFHDVMIYAGYTSSNPLMGKLFVAEESSNAV